MVDFFWNVGAPESEIDRLNDVGALINPAKIGSWIDMSAKGGMDGGWYFPVDILMKMAIEAADPGEPSKKVLEWSEKHSVEKCFSVGRDMGAAPPRQTEIRVMLPGTSFDSQLAIAEDAFAMFDFPPIPEGSMEVLKEWQPAAELCLSVITSSEGFVRLGLMVPNPSTERVVKFCQLVDAGNEQIAALEGALGSDGPEYVELQYLKAGFGYGVYKEGFDVVFHYHAGLFFSVPLSLSLSLPYTFLQEKRKVNNPKLGKDRKKDRGREGDYACGGRVPHEGSIFEMTINSNFEKNKKKTKKKREKRVSVGGGCLLEGQKKKKKKKLRI